MILFLQLCFLVVPASLSDFLVDYYSFLPHQLSLCDDLKSLWKKGLSTNPKRIYMENLRKTICNLLESHIYTFLGHLHKICNFSQLGTSIKLNLIKIKIKRLLLYFVLWRSSQQTRIPLKTPLHPCSVCSSDIS